MHLQNDDISSRVSAIPSVALQCLYYPSNIIFLQNIMGKTGSSFRADQAPRPHLTPLA